MKTKKAVLFLALIWLLGILNFHLLTRQKNDTCTVVYQLNIKKSELFSKAPT
ncbi:hypothetical protein [Sphingobacterium sp. BIGb0165]|uniref:hypothetical protein n=1 Tax=Sphingobacterium sp. BIGb0165 TaxID=2940615 RepID=UPI002168236C|nr:hypothetical protein [Sphingobacterium sp. BIGb0165]MCS4224137.1 hypothetical protein [Sphingobacterium sp. BIGb0165]